jgi:hypothetical protein
VRVERIHWSGGTTAQRIPAPPPETDRIVVVSPFIDKSFLAQIAPTGKKPARRVLLTTLSEIERLGPSLKSFEQLLALDAPNYPVVDTETDLQQSSHDATTDSEEEEIGHGLHAKLLFMQSGQKRRLWVGSANATMRGWSGRNAEVMAELLVSETVANGLEAFLGGARIVDAPAIESSPDESAQEDKELEVARS